MSKLRQIAAEPGSTFGTWVTLGNTISGELIARAGYDWVILDTQHGGITWDNMLPMIQVMDLTATPSLVRVGWNDPMQIMRALDLGAAGVVVPMVSTPEQALAAARACRYPPYGIRSFGPVRMHYVSGATASDPLCIVMIETAEAMENLEAIAATPGVDGLLVGPVDLALSMGLGAALVMPPEIVAAVDRVAQVCREQRRISCVAALGPANAAVMVGLGVDLVTLGSDCGQIRKGSAADLDQARSWPVRDATGASG